MGFGTTSEPALDQGNKFWTFDIDITHLRAAIFDSPVIPGGLMEFQLSNPLQVTPDNINVPIWATATLKLQFEKSCDQGAEEDLALRMDVKDKGCNELEDGTLPAVEVLPLLDPSLQVLPGSVSINGAGDG